MAPLAPVPKVPLEDTHINRRPGVADPRDIEASLCQEAILEGGLGALRWTLLPGGVEGRSVRCWVRE
jgi:hypothetical protein